MDGGPPVTARPMPQLNQDSGSGRRWRVATPRVGVLYTARVCCTSGLGHSFPLSVARRLEDAGRVGVWVWVPDPS